MSLVDAIVLSGAGALAVGAMLAAWPGRLQAGLRTQAAGMALLGGAAAALVAGHDVIGTGFTSGISPSLGLDPLSAFFVLVVAISAVPALVFAGPYVAQARTSPAVGALTGAFLLALVGVLAARDVTTFLAFWELMTLVPAAAILVARREARERSAVFLYVAITHVGGAGVWIALLALARHGAIGDPAALARAGAGTQTLVAIAALIGFGTKAGFVPLHAWLPRAHPVAPAHLSALMSGVMIKVAIYGLIRVEFGWLGATPLWLGIALLAIGLLSSLGGVLWAVVQHDLKRLLAYSSIENIGIIALGLGASLLFARAGAPAWAAIAFAAALLHVANHAIFKTLLFLCAGALERAVGALEIDRLGGLLRRMPWVGGAFLVGSMAIAGVPPLNGFASEWLTLQSLLHAASHSPAGVAVASAVALAGLGATAALALLCFVKVVGLVLLGEPRTEEAATAVDAPAGMRGALAALAVLCVVIGVIPGLIVPSLTRLVPGATGEAISRHAALVVGGTGSLPGVALALAIVLPAFLLIRARGSRRAAPAPTWVCGQRVTPALAWTSAGFAKPLRLVLEAVLRPRRELEVVVEAGRVERIVYTSHVPSLADTALYEPAIRGGLRGAEIARRLQTGNVRTYALYLLVLVLGLLGLVRTGALG